MRVFAKFSQSKSGASAVEFAIIAPVFIMLVTTFIGYGIYLGAAHSVQQLAAEAARASVAGLSESERSKLATDFIASSAANNTFIDPSRLQVSVAMDASDSELFSVSLSYDASQLPIWSLYSFAMPNTQIERVSRIRVGGV